RSRHASAFVAACRLSSLVSSIPTDATIPAAGMDAGTAGGAGGVTDRKETDQNVVALAMAAKPLAGRVLAAVIRAAGSQPAAHSPAPRPLHQLVTRQPSDMRAARFSTAEKRAECVAGRLAHQAWVGTKCGVWRTWVTASNPEANRISVPSSQARPMNVTPTGRP